MGLDIFLWGMTNKHTEPTITENLDEYRELYEDGYSKTEIAEKMDFTNARITQFAEFWFAVDHNLLAPQLIRVIRAHNNIHVRRGRRTELFRLGKMSKPGTDRLIFSQNPYYPERSVRFTARQQAAALQETFESAKKWRGLRPEVQTIEECTDEQLRTFSYNLFMFCLRRDEIERGES